MCSDFLYQLRKPQTPFREIRVMFMFVPVRETCLTHVVYRSLSSARDVYGLPCSELPEIWLQPFVKLRLVVDCTVN